MLTFIIIFISLLLIVGGIVLVLYMCHRAVISLSKNEPNKITKVIQAVLVFIFFVALYVTGIIETIEAAKLQDKQGQQQATISQGR